MAIKTSAQIAGFDNVKLVSEGVALALVYGSRRKEFVGNRTVAFVDFGHSKSSLTFIKFTSDSFEILAHYSDRNLGVRNID